MNGEGGIVSFADPLLTIDGGSYTISMEEGVTSTSQRIEITDGATVTLDGVTIDDSTDGPAITISGSQDVTILIADGSKNVLKGKAGSSSSNLGAPGIQKTDSASGWLIIGIPENSEGTGELEATGGYYAAGIGGGYNESVSNIKITGGVVTANGGNEAAGIGGALAATVTQNVNNITITGGTIIAEGGDEGDGIGAGDMGMWTVNNITITGGKVTAKAGNKSGAQYGSGIGGGSSGNVSNINISGGIIEAYGTGMGGYGIGGGQASNNHISGDDVVVIAESAYVYALEGFDSIDKGLIFRKGYETSNQWQAKMNNSVTLNANVEFPANCTIPDGKTLTVGANAALTLASDATLTVSAGAELANEGTISDATEANIDNSGTISTKANFYLKETDKTPYTSQYQTYKTGDAGGTYTNLPNPDVEAKRISDKKADKFSNWYYLNGEEKVAIKDGDNVLLNQHTFYEETVPAPDPEPEPAPGTQDGWVESDAGWQYVLNGEFLNDGWHYVEDEYGNHWYYFDTDAYIATSRWIWDDEYEGWYWLCSTGPMIENLWQWIDNAWYGFWWGGKMCQGWVWDIAYVAWYYCDDYTGRVACNEWAWDGAWYYFNQNCQMLTNTWVGDYWLNEHGMWV